MATNEHDEVEALKNWWRESGVSTVSSIVFAVAIFFAWQAWQNSQQLQLENSAVGYDQFLLAISDVENNPNDITIATVMNLADGLKKDYSNTGFAYFAAFFKAKQYVIDSDFDNAKLELEWVLAQKPAREIQLLAQLRLARLLNEMNDTEAAMALINQENLGAFEPSFLEVKGDILLAQGNYTEAADAYTLSSDASERLQLAASPTLAFKLDYAQSF